MFDKCWNFLVQTEYTKYSVVVMDRGEELE